MQTPEPTHSLYYSHNNLTLGIITLYHVYNEFYREVTMSNKVQKDFKNEVCKNVYIILFFSFIPPCYIKIFRYNPE